MIELTLRALSLYGKKIVSSLKATEQALNMQCSCPRGQSCSIEVNELPGRRFEVIVTRPSPVLGNHGWTIVASPATAKYRRLFEKRTSADRIRESVTSLVALPLRVRSEVPSDLSPDAQNIVLVDAATLGKLERLLVGCQACSPFAKIPFARLLDRLKNPVAHTYYMLEVSLNCPRCRRVVAEETLVELNGES